MTTQHFDVLIIGAGLSGIGTACHLTTRQPGRSIAILERRERIGGTWDLFRYPGIRSDADMLTMAYEFRPWRNPQVLASGEAIRQYIAETAAAYGVDEKIHYGLRIVAAHWSSTDGRWTLTAHRETTGETCRYSCRYLIACTGYYDHDTGYLPALPGSNRFSGRIVHPQHWPEDLEYAGKNIIVIGSGATAVTLVPALAGSAGHVTMLQRSPAYVLSLPSVDKISQWLARFVRPRTGLCPGPQAQHRSAAPGLFGMPALAAPEQTSLAVVGATPARTRLRHASFHAAIPAMGRAHVHGPRR